MLHLIERALPARVHRALLPWAHAIRRKWRQLTKAQLRGVSVILTNDADQVLLLRHSYGRPQWGIAGGGLSRGEDPAQCARREMREELGLELGELRLLGELDEVISGAPHHAYVFTAECVGEPIPDQREILEARFFARDQLPEAISELTLRRLDLLKRR